MKERPIIFSAPMVRAILDGRKTQTRRVAKIARIDAHPQDARVKIATMAGRGEQFWMNCQPEHPQHISRACPYGAPGDRLWVRESWAAPHSADQFRPAHIPNGTRIHYAATEDRGGLLWRPSIHMPRWASRITLEIVSVRVERVQDISEWDCWEEGIEEWLKNDKNLPRYSDGTPSKYINIKQAFAAMWNSTNAKRAPWESNPWVWAIAFRRIDA